MNIRSTAVPFRPVRPVLVLLAGAFMMLAASGCAGSGDGDPQKTVADPGGLFHFKIPADWQSNIEQGLISVYGAAQLPESGEPEALSLVVLSAKAPEAEAPADARVAEIVELRAQSRGWREYTVGDPEEVPVGGRVGVRVEVSGIDSEGRAFEGAYHLVRTAGSEVLIVAVSPEGQWERNRESLDSVFGQWYWLRPETVE